MSGVFAGMVTGVLIAALLMIGKHDPIIGLNAGFIALCCNFAVTGVVSFLTYTGDSGFAPDFVSTPASLSRDNQEPTRRNFT